MNFLRKMMNERQGSVQIAGKNVEVPLLTPDKYKQIFNVMNDIPSIAFYLFYSKEEPNFKQRVLVAVSEALDELLYIVELLTGIDKETLNKKAAVHELVEFFVRTAEKNEINNLLKNVKSLLPNK